MDSGEVTTDDITSNTNQMNKSAWYSYGSLPHQHTKCKAKITDRQHLQETLLSKPTKTHQKCPYNKSSTLPRPPKVKLNMEKGEDKKVSCF